MNGYSIYAIRNDGERFNYENADWALTSVKGFDFPEIEVFTENNGIGDGDIITGIRRQSRTPELSCVLRKQNQSTYSNVRSKAIGFHNVRYTYDVYITYAGMTKIAKNCVIKAASYPTERYRRNATMTIMFLSAEPDLYGANDEILSFVSTNPLWHDTRVYVGDSGTLAFGVMEKTTERVIDYTGTENTPIRVTVNATGLVEGVIVSIGDNSATINTELHESDVMIIDTGERMVYKNNIPVAYTDYDASALMPLVLTYGDNVVNVYSSSNAFDAEVDYVGKYGGL